MGSYLRICRRDWIWLAVILAALPVAWQAVLAVIALVMKQAILPAMGCIMFPIIAGILILAVGLGNMLFLYDLSLKLGRTRRATVAGLLGYGLLQALAVMLAGWASGQLEEVLTYRLWPLMVPNIGIDRSLDIFPLWALLLVAVGCALAAIVIGGLIHRFGRRAGWTIWGIWMVMIFGQGYLDLGWLEKLVPALLWGGGVLLAGLLLWAFRYLLHAPVKN